MKKINSRFPGLRVLVVEDYFINREVTKELLELMQCEVDVVEDGNQAIEMGLTNTYDLIMMDLQLPNLDGYEAAKQMRAQMTATPPPIIVALTANAMEGDREKCLQSGMNDYISKPMEAERLEEILRKYFSNKMLIAQ